MLSQFPVVVAVLVVIGFSVATVSIVSVVLLTGLRSLAYVFNHTPLNKLNTSVTMDPGSVGTREIRLSTRLTAPACAVCCILVPPSGWLFFYVVRKMLILTIRTHVIYALDHRIIACSFAFCIPFVSTVFFSLCNLQEIGEKFFDIHKTIQPKSSGIENVQPKSSHVESTSTDQNVQLNSSNVESTLNNQNVQPNSSNVKSTLYNQNIQPNSSNVVISIS
ncbi:hypothetical protein V6N12_061840 [Hibiscus sabdariffa]|uniref:Uncharacterized protein n=1 Tax=Hibiscus sabdariffa TaxID=183260 RepID=A0ABR2DY80_9ROSI